MIRLLMVLVCNAPLQLNLLQLNYIYIIILCTIMTEAIYLFVMHHYIYSLKKFHCMVSDTSTNRQECMMMSAFFGHPQFW